MPPHRRFAAGSPPASEPSTGNPFRIGGVVSAPFFTDREPERARVRRALTTDQDHLVVYGTRRMGKTSILRVVQEELRAEEHPVILADLSTAASLAEMTTRILQAATRELGRTWGESATALVQRLRAKVTLEPDATTGMLLPSVDVGLGAADLGTQRTTFASALDAIESLAEAKEKHLGLILDEFQEIRKFDGETAEAHLRGGASSSITGA
jgi:AAA+ ATPase superfamily predicted ATPase